MQLGIIFFHFVSFNKYYNFKNFYWTSRLRLDTMCMYEQAFLNSCSFYTKVFGFCLASYQIPFQIEGMFNSRYCFCSYVGSFFQIEGMFNRRYCFCSYVSSVSWLSIWTTWSLSVYLLKKYVELLTWWYGFLRNFSLWIFFPFLMYIMHLIFLFVENELE